MSVMVAPSAHNTFVPDHEASGRMKVDFSRDVSSFTLNRFCQIVPVKKTDGLYLEMTNEMAGRVLNSDLSDLVWPDGAPAPVSRDNLEEFKFLPYRTTRYAPDFVLGDITAEQATWDIMEQHLTIQSLRMMTARTLKVLTALLNTANYASNHYGAVSSLNGASGTWAAATTANQNIKRSLNHAALVINKDTLGAVKAKQLKLVISPSLASVMGVSQEIADFVKGSPDAHKYVTDNLGPNSEYGLPGRLYGFDVEIEDAVRVSSRKGATVSKDYIMPSDKAVMCSRVGKLEGKTGPNFSTICLFMREEMTVEKKHDVDNRRMLGRVVDDWDCKLTAPVSGFVFTGCQ